PDVDGVYWTLAAELSFYVVMFVLFSLGLLRGNRLIGSLLGWLILSQLIAESLRHVHRASYDAFFGAAGVIYAPRSAAGIALYAIRPKRGHAWFYWALLVAAPLLEDRWQ